MWCLSYYYVDRVWCSTLDNWRATAIRIDFKLAEVFHNNEYGPTRRCHTYPTFIRLRAKYKTLPSIPGFSPHRQYPYGSGPAGPSAPGPTSTYQRTGTCSYFENNKTRFHWPPFNQLWIMAKLWYWPQANNGLSLNRHGRSEPSQPHTKPNHGHLRPSVSV